MLSGCFTDSAYSIIQPRVRIFLDNVIMAWYTVILSGLEIQSKIGRTSAAERILPLESRWCSGNLTCKKAEVFHFRALTGWRFDVYCPWQELRVSLVCQLSPFRR